MRSLVLLALIALASPLAAKDSLGVFSSWGAFRDPAVPRCYAIAMANRGKSDRSSSAYATVATWPKKQLRGQVHFRLSRSVAKGSRVSVQVGGKAYRLTGTGADFWAQNKAMDAAIVAAMRSASSMVVRATDKSGRGFANSYALAGAATAIDAAAIACARRN